MAKPKAKTDRRDEALSRDRIVEAAIELLDREGEAGLTFRALATHLATGPGAIYWHVANKGELLAAASDAVVARALTDVRASTSARKSIRALSVRVFEAVDAHPWVGTELSQNPWPTAMLRIFERLGQQVEALGVSGAARFTATMVLVSYVVGESRQNAANGLVARQQPERADLLESMATQWGALDAREYPFTRTVAARLREHDDRTEFLAGIDLILAGLAASGRP